MKKMNLIIVLLVSSFSLFAQVNIKINAAGEQKDVSPYLYGKNNSTSHKPSSPTSPEDWTRIKDAGVTILRESEGNNSTKYNWRKKLLSAPDWFNQVSPCDWDYEALELQKNYPEAQGMWSFQLLGKAASSLAHNYDAWSLHINNNLPWPPVSVHQNLTGGGIPNLEPGAKNALKDGDINLYLQDWPVDSSVAILDHWFGENGLGLDKNKIQYWCMDNEVELWSGTHNDVQPPLSAEQFIQNYVRAAKLAREKFPDIKLVGPAACNEWFWYASWGKHSPKIWLEYFIKRIAEEQKSSGVKLLDVFDIHFYPGSTDPKELVQMHRIYFDKEYAFPEASGVSLVNGGWDTSIKEEYIFERCREWMNQYFGPDHGITFGVTETGIKDVDPSVTAVWYASTIGEFMRYDVEVFTPWSWKKGMWETLHLFSRYNKPFYVKSVSSNEEMVSAYPTINKTQDTLVVVLVNRSVDEIQNTSIEIDHFALANQKFEMLTLSDLPSEESFKNHYINALKSSSIESNGNMLQIQLQPMSVSSITLVSKEKPTIINGKVGNDTPSNIDLKLNMPIIAPESCNGFIATINNIDTIIITGFAVNHNDPSCLQLNLERPITKDESVSISYSGNIVQSLDSLSMREITNFPIQNLLNGSSPLLTSIITNDSTSLLLTFNKKISEASGNGFSIKSNKEFSITNSTFDNADSTKILLYLSENIEFGDKLIIEYEGSSIISIDGGILNPLKENVENTLLPPSPNLLSASVTDYGYAVTLEFDLDMFYSFSQKDFFSIKSNQQELNLKNLETIGKTIVVSLNDVINAGETITISYTGGTLASIEGGQAADFIDFQVTNSLASFTVFDIPGKVEAEGFAASEGIQTENTTDQGGGLNIGYIDNNDWLEYAINVPAGGTYTLRLRVAANSSKGEIAVQLPEHDFLNIGNINLPITGAWQKWVNIALPIELEEGTQRLRLYAKSGGFNLNWFELESGNTIIDPVLESAMVTEDGNSIKLTFDVELADIKGKVDEFVLKVNKSTDKIKSVKFDSDKRIVILSLSNTITKTDNPIKISYEGESFLSIPGVLVQKFNNIIVENTSTITSVANYPESIDIALYPSPASEKINFNAPFEIKNIEIINSYGKVITKETFDSNSGVIQLKNHLPIGVYIIIFETQKGLVIKKFIQK